MSPTAITIRTATSEEDIKAFKALSIQYFEWLGEDLSFQDIEKELQDLPGAYAPPTGALLVAVTTTQAGEELPVGIVAVRPQKSSPELEQAGEHVPSCCEMKRLFVPTHRQGQGIGQQLVTAVKDTARGLGYRKMLLDTLRRLEAANSVYTRTGFVLRSPYYANPLEEVLYFETEL